MGYPMAVNLAKSLSSADTLSVFDVMQPALDAFRKDVPHADIAISSTNCIDKSDTIITMLPNTSHVQDVFKPFISPSSSSSITSKLFIDSSTISPAATVELAREISNAGATLVDAPVSGGVIGATAGTLTFMVSHPPSLSDHQRETLERLLSVMGKRTVVCGNYAGAGLAAKLANNYALAMTNLATCDAMLLGQKLGLDPHVLAQVLNTSTGKCWPSESNNPVPGVLPNAPASRDYEGGFGIGLMRKDLQLALDAEMEAGKVASTSDQSIASSTNAVTGGLSKLSTVALDLYKQVEADSRYNGKDFSVVYKYLKENAQ